MTQHAYIIAGVAFVLALGAVVYLIQTRRNAAAGERRPWFHYFLLWPIVLDVDKTKRGGRVFTKRELIGWGVVILLIVAAVVFT